MNPDYFLSSSDTYPSQWLPKGIVDGEYDDVPEQAFYMVGTIEEVLEKAKNL